jgi:NitT/TauT family transport system substrate-binding protein
MSRCAAILKRGVLLVALLALPRTGESAEERLELVVVGVPTKVVQFAPFYLGAKKGIYAAEGLHVEVVQIRTAATLAALLSGDMGYSGAIGSAIRSIGAGAPLKIVVSMRDKSNFYLIARPEIRSFGDLKGKKIGVQQIGSGQSISTRMLMVKKGLNPDRDVTFVSGNPTPIAFQGVKTGVIDAATVSSPFQFLARRSGLNVLSFLGDDVPEAPSGTGIATTEKKIQSRPDQVRKMIRATLKALRYFKENPAEVQAILMRDFGVQADLVKDLYEEAVEMFVFQGSLDPVKIQAQINMAKEGGQKLPPDFGPEKVIAAGFLKDVQSELGMR